MKLKQVKIKNFRSIQDQVFEFERNFQILVGINESGKTNLIKAISLLDKEREFAEDDIRDPGFEEEPVSESYVKFIFTLGKSDIDRYFNEIKKVVLTDNIDRKLLQFDEKEYSLYGFCRQKDEVVYCVDLLKNNRSVKHYRHQRKIYEISPDWRIVKKGSSCKFDANGKIFNLASYSIINKKEYNEIPEEYLGKLDLASLNNIIGSHLVDYAKGRLPNCIVWKYSEQNLLPGRIPLTAFITDPNSCIPLKNMFSLAGYDDITISLQNASKKTNGLRNLLRKTSENSTGLMQKVWPEWKNQKVNLIQNGDFIEAGIEDEYNIFSLSRRSDGFKRFFTFLLMISAQNKTEKIHDNIIVIDEPDTGLHPTGVQYLRDELIKIGEQNLVIVSTHSIFMIDKEIVDRHLIIEKSKEITTFKRVGISNINDEEVIYKALGFSLYELLKPKNIIFEGWRDKKVLEILFRSNKGKKIFNKQIKTQVGLLHALGVKDIQRVANFCENVSRDYIIISDSDKPAKEKQRVFEGLGKWICYDDIDGVEAVTTEDFYENSFINKAIRDTLNNNDIEMVIQLEDNIDKDKLSVIERELKNTGLPAVEIKPLLNQVKEYCCLNIKAINFNDNLYKVAEMLIEKLYG